MSAPSLVALVPVLDRPRNVGPLAESFFTSFPGEPVERSLLFLVNPEDQRELEELRARGLWHLVVPWRNGPGDYAKKMNWGVRHTTSDWILLAADDVRFHPGWFRAAVDVHIRTGALVVGTNDTVNPHVLRGKHATHPLLHRDYVRQGTIDDPKLVLHEGYMHNSVDVEFCETAQARGQWAFARESVVEHRHPVFDRKIKRDMTYQKGIRFANRDKMLCNRRRHLWDPDAPRSPTAVRSSTNTGRGRLRVARPDPISTWPPR